MNALPESVSAATLSGAREFVLKSFSEAGSFRGELSSSALSTATAVIALELAWRRLAGAAAAELEPLVEGGLRWLADHQNRDGSYGDTPDSPGNLSTATLVWVAFGLAPAGNGASLEHLERLEQWLRGQVGELSRENLSRALIARYGKDRTFSVPILTACALGGRFGEGRDAWSSFPALPFELSACPRRWFRVLGLPMVSYALPALIALGQVRHARAPSRNPIARLLRGLTAGRTLELLREIQPESGGYLEATPLSSFVLMSLCGLGRESHPVARRVVEFLRRSARPDGSFPIDTNLDTWTTTLAVQALAAGGRLDAALAPERRARIRDWLLAQQYREEHPYTLAPPGGFAWTDRSGGVPDADDTAGALFALWQLSEEGRQNGELLARVEAAVVWLLDLQNRDGGIPTFCRGFGSLPFDRSSPDLTAHALQAWQVWRPHLEGRLSRRVAKARERALDYLRRTQLADGSWIPLWFGNQREAREANPLYGTSRVVRVLPEGPELARAVDWLIDAQAEGGGFGAGPGVPPSLEETGLALEALAVIAAKFPRLRPAIRERVLPRGAAWAARASDRGTRFPAAPIGLYFARLWYSERLYPAIFLLGALERIFALDR